MANTIDFKVQFEDFATDTDTQRINARRDRDYRDHKQWTESQKKTLENRGQAAVVINRIAPKVDFMIGVERSTRQDPKAWPRTPQHEDGANAATDGLRYVADNTDFDVTSSDCFEDLLVEGVEGAITEWIDDEIVISRIPFDRIYYDPHSSRRHFQDATYKGLVIWMEEDQANAMFDGKGTAESIAAAFTTQALDEGFEDKPRNAANRWTDKGKRRLKVCQHYYLDKGVWHVVYFSGDIELMKPEKSPYLDDKDEPECPIELAFAYIDRDNERYGWTRQFIWIQDEINHRRSKALYLLSRRQVIADRGAVDDINAAKAELAKGDGMVEVTPGARFDVDPGNDLAAGQAQLLQEAKLEIDSIAARSLVSPDASGRARQVSESKDMLEVGPLFDTHRQWKKRVYRQAWNRIRQYWKAPRWIRVTDNEDNLKFVGLNQPITAGQKLEEMAQQGDQQAAQSLQQMVQANDPRLNEPVDVENNVAELDVDIMLGESVDTSNIQQEQFEVLANLAQTYGPQSVPFETVVEMSQLRNKRDIMDKLKGDPEQAQQRQQVEMAQLQQQMEGVQAKIDNMLADTLKKNAETDKLEQQTVQTAVETEVLTMQPVDSVSINT